MAGVGGVEHVDACGVPLLGLAVVDSVGANNGSTGIGANSTTNGAVTNMMVVRSRAAYNLFGIAASSTSANTVVRLTQSAVTGNATAVSIAAPAVVRSFGDNQINANLGGESVSSTIGKK